MMFQGFGLSRFIVLIDQLHPVNGDRNNKRTHITHSQLTCAICKMISCRNDCRVDDRFRTAIFTAHNELLSLDNLHEDSLSE